MDASTIVHTGKLPQFRGRRSQRQPPQKVNFQLHEPVLRPARIAMIMAMARKFERMVKSGEVSSYKDLAIRSGVTNMRITQIMNLTLLAPDIQREILRLRSMDGIEPITERKLRDLVKLEGWGEQREKWNGYEVVASRTPDSAIVQF
jgi:hypothetical protein